MRPEKKKRPLEKKMVRGLPGVFCALLIGLVTAQVMVSPSVLATSGGNSGDGLVSPSTAPSPSAVPISLSASFAPLGPSNDPVLQQLIYIQSLVGYTFLLLLISLPMFMLICAGLLVVACTYVFKRRFRHVTFKEEEALLS